jgi:hypothetical protein
MPLVKDGALLQLISEEAIKRLDSMEYRLLAGK